MKYQIKFITKFEFYMNYYTEKTNLLIGTISICIFKKF